MTAWGYTLSSEEHSPTQLVANARAAEAHDFEFLSISDHYHPWIDAQGHSGFVWGTIGGIAATTQMKLGVGVACPILRIHPAIIAQAAATASEMLQGRFFLGVGTGELLNEHVLGQRWPAIEIRQAMLVEAVEVMRRLWTGDVIDHHGEHFEVENARIYDPPPAELPVVVSAFGPSSARLAADIGDGLWSTSPDVIGDFRDSGGSGMTVGQLTLCWASTEDEAVATARANWPNTALPGQLAQELPTPATFEQATELVTNDMIAEKIPCGPDPEPVLDRLRSYAEAGFDHVHLHQIGEDQEGFMRFWTDELRPKL